MKVQYLFQYRYCSGKISTKTIENKMCWKKTLPKTTRRMEIYPKTTKEYFFHFEKGTFSEKFVFNFYSIFEQTKQTTQKNIHQERAFLGGWFQVSTILL